MHNTHGTHVVNEKQSPTWYLQQAPLNEAPASPVVGLRCPHAAHPLGHSSRPRQDHPSVRHITFLHATLTLRARPCMWHSEGSRRFSLLALSRPGANATQSFDVTIAVFVVSFFITVFRQLGGRFRSRCRGRSKDCRLCHNRES